MNDFEEYIKQCEPDKKEKGLIWQTAIGLQQVDGLKPSEYLIQTAIQNIEGDITFEEVKNLIDNYYKTQVARQDNNQANADVNDTVTSKYDTVKTGNDTVNDTVFNLIKENPTITAEEIRIKLNIGIATVKRKIKMLKEKGIITRLGSDKTGSWKIN